jgi:PleD family two-component response regulator
MTSTTTEYRVLLVDDDAALLRMVRLAFATEGFDVATAENGLQALASGHERIRPDRPRPAMSWMDGRTFYRQLGSRLRHRRLDIVGYGAAAAQRELQAQGSLANPLTLMLVRAARRLIEARSDGESMGGNR